MYVRDLRLWLFALLALLASIISAHGAWVFFGYLVDPWLAGIFTTVIALGIVGLDAAATVERQRGKRAAYISGVVLFLAMEVLANYFAGQASFVQKVASALGNAPGADLRAITANHPAITRALVVLFLSLASIAVAAFVFAAASRVQTLARRGHVRVVPRQRRALIRRLVRLLRVAADEAMLLRGEHEQLRANAVAAQATAAELEQTNRRAVDAAADVEATLAASRAEAAALRGEATDLRAAAVERERDAARSSTLLREAVDERERAVDVATRLRGETDRLRAERDSLRADLAQARADAARPVDVAVPTVAGIVAYAQVAVDAGRSLADVARETGFKESTLRDWMKVMKAATNGHVVESSVDR